MSQTDKPTAAAAIESMMEESRKFPPPPEFASKAHIKSVSEYEQMYRESIESPETFWQKQSETLQWEEPWTKLQSWDKEKVEVRWFEGGKLNVTVNCLDRHLSTGRRNKVALLWVGDDPSEERSLSYQDVHREVCRFANVMKRQGVKKGDRVCIYMPMVPEAAIGMLACARIGAVHSVVFGGFSSDSLRDRINDSTCKLVLTANEGVRGGKKIPLKEISDRAVEDCPSVEKVIVLRRTDVEVPMKEGRDLWWHEEISDPDVPLDCPPEPMDSEDPLFILYTSGSTGKPKGVMHTTGGYLLYASLTHKYVFDIKEEDVYWCTADVGWITGHSYVVYGPLANGTTSIMFEGVPTYPEADRFWQVVERHRVNVFYTAPTAIRALMSQDDSFVTRRDRSSLRLLGTVGEPINPEAWMWYLQKVGDGRCPIVDTWWQTETGGIMLTSLPGAVPTKPGSAGRPFFGVQPEVVKEDGTPVGPNEGGMLILKRPWPGMMRTVYGHHERFVETYFSRFPPYYLTGDGARFDEEGDFWLMGRIDDVLNVSAHRIGTAEVESALVSHTDVAEAAVVGFPHDVKGQGIYAYVTLNAGTPESDDLLEALRQHVGKVIGPIAKPDKVQFSNALPKTRSGKIMRRILRKIAEGDTSNLGDTSTLADPSVVEKLVSGAK